MDNHNFHNAGSGPEYSDAAEVGFFKQGALFCKQSELCKSCHYRFCDTAHCCLHCSFFASARVVHALLPEFLGQTAETVYNR